MRVNTQKILLKPTILKIISNFIEDKPILITGAPRSGTSWVGKMLTLLPTVVYISEPFQYEHGILTDKNLIKQRFTFIIEENERQYLNILDKILHFDILSLEQLDTYSSKIPLYILIRRLLYYRFFSSRKIRGLIKDPNAIFSAEWFERMFNMKIVITIRHPAGFVSSLKRLGWRVNFNDFLQQKRLMEYYLNPFEKEMRKPNKDIIYEGALLWKCFYSVVDKYRQKHPDWIFIRHEDLCRNPAQEFENLYKRLKLPFSQGIRRKIIEYSSIENLIEPPNNEVNYLKRNSQSLIKQWKQRLTKEEIKRIRDITGELSTKFYTDDEW